VRALGDERTVSQQFVDRVEARFVIPEGVGFFTPATNRPMRVNGRFQSRHKLSLGRS
jgi:hypothetical protein